MSAATIEDVYDEMQRAWMKHGPNYMGNLPQDDPDELLLAIVAAAGRDAKLRLDRGVRSRVGVIAEELGEVADAIRSGDDPTGEWIQVAAMALAALGIEPPEVYR